MMIDFKGQKALVTGGTRGIGKAIAMELAKHGCDVALNYLRNKVAAKETADEIEAATGIKPLLLKCNVSSEENVAEMFEELKKEWDYLDIFISNAASGVLKPGMELTKHHWEWTMNINAGALLWLMQGAVPMMEGREGRMVATSSLGSIRAFNNYHAVGASKGALESLVRHFAVELGPQGIRCNIVNAGAVDTDALKHFPNRDEMLSNSLERSPLGRLVTAEDVAKAAIFLVSDYARMVNGQTLIVDGGQAITI